MDQNLELKARQYRRDVLDMLFACQSGHPGGSLSCVEILQALYENVMRYDPKNPKWADRDRLVLSKGHACPTLYAILADKGFFPKEELKNLRQYGSFLQGHPDMNKCPGIDASTGSLGQGASWALGYALAGKRAEHPFNVYCITGDGESQEGMVWESAMAAAHYKLDNLTVMVDNNGLQIDGKNDDVMSLGSVADKFRAFGFNVIELADGNDIDQVVAALDAPAVEGKPKCIVAHTVKGKGVSFMENNAGWHGTAPNEEQRLQALKDLED